MGFSQDKSAKLQTTVVGL